MSVIIKELEIENFRSCKNTKIILNNFSALIGYNNAGKSNIILAIKFLLEATNARSFNYSNNANDATQPIIVSALLTNLTEDNLQLLDDDHAERLRPYIQNQNLRIQRISQLDTQGRQKISIKLFDGNTWTLNPAGIDQAIIKLFPTFIHIGAMTDANEDSTKNKSGTAIAKLLSLISETIQQNYHEDFTNSLSRVSELLAFDSPNRITDLSTVDSGINQILNNFFPDISVKLHFPTPTIEDIFKNGTLKVFENEDTERDFSNFGHGTQRSIQMALIRYLASIQQENPNLRRSNTILCIDEPELYLHPTTIELVRDAFMTLAQAGFQVVFSTHSASLLSAQHAMNAVQIFKTSELGTQARQPISTIISELYEQHYSQLDETFKLNNASQIFFCDEVLLVEGKTELRVLPSIYSKINASPFHLRKLALVAVQGKQNLILMQRVIEALGIPTRIIADLDFVGNCAQWNLIDESSQECFDKFRKFIFENREHPNLELSVEQTANLQALSTIKAKKYTFIASLPHAAPLIQDVHNALKEKRIYIWKKGDIESIYGFNSKKEQEWQQFNSALINPECSISELVADYEHLRESIEWIN